MKLLNYMEAKDKAIELVDKFEIKESEIFKD